MFLPTWVVYRSDVATVTLKIPLMRSKFLSKCRRLGIEGTNVKLELLQQLDDLPRLYEDIAADCQQLHQVVDFYNAFLAFLQVGEDSNFLPILRHILLKGKQSIHALNWSSRTLSKLGRQKKYRLNRQHDGLRVPDRRGAITRLSPRNSAQRRCYRRPRRGGRHRLG